MNEDKKKLTSHESLQDENLPLIAVKTKKHHAREKNPSEILPIWIKVVFGLPCFFYSVYSFKYYTDVVGLSLDYLNLAYILVLFIVVLMFPVLGWIFDKTNTRFGRRRPWMAAGAPLLYTFCILLWLTPSSFGILEKWFSLQACQSGYYTLIYTFIVLLTYVVQTPYLALGVEMTLDFDERSSLFSVWQAFYMIGMVVATGLPEFLQKWFPNTRMLFLMISGVTGAIGTITFWIMIFLIKERADFKRPKTTPLIPGIRATLLENRPFIYLLMVITLQNSAPYTLSLLPYWVQYTLQLNDLWGSIIMIVFIVFGFGFIPFWNFISKIWGKRKAYLMSLIASVIGFALLAVPQEGQHWFALAAIAFAGLNGIFLTGSNFLYQSLQGDVMDYDELRTGLRREALYTNVMQLCNWYMSVFSTSAPFILLQVLGFNADHKQTPRVRIGLGIIVGAASLFSLIAVFILLFYPISKQKYYAILEAIEKHKEGLPAVDPLTNEIIQPHNKLTDEEFEIYWLLYTFSHSELKTAIKSRNRMILFIFLRSIFIWLCPLIASSVMWHYYPNWYYIWAYTDIVCVCMLCYNMLRIKSGFKLKRMKLDNSVILNYIKTKEDRKRSGKESIQGE